LTRSEPKKKRKNAEEKTHIWPSSHIKKGNIIAEKLSERKKDGGTINLPETKGGETSKSASSTKEGNGRKNGCHDLRTSNVAVVMGKDRRKIRPKVPERR